MAAACQERLFHQGLNSSSCSAPPPGCCFCFMIYGDFLECFSCSGYCKPLSALLAFAGIKWAKKCQINKQTRFLMSKHKVTHSRAKILTEESEWAKKEAVELRWTAQQTCQLREESKFCAISYEDGDWKQNGQNSNLYIFATAAFGI